MSMLHKGTMTAVVATVIASGMIVLTGNGVAEDKEIKANTGNAVSSMQSDGIPKKLANTEKQTISKASINVGNNIPLAPPPGPFLNESIVIPVPKTLLAPAEPKVPVSLSKEPEQRDNSLRFKEAPSLSQKVVEPKADLNKPSEPTKPSIAPKLSQNAPQLSQSAPKKMGLASAPKQVAMPESKATVSQAPIAPKNITKQPEMKSADLPIWVQQGKDARKAPKGPSNSAAQQYIYVPVPMMPSNMAPPQMPMFNRNIIPPSNYWKAPIAPNNVPNIAIQKESTGSTTAPLKKGDE